MRNQNGWVKLHRKILDHELVQKDKSYLYYMMWFIANASYEDGEKTKRGELISSDRKLASEMGVSYQQMRTILKHLKATQFLTQESTQLATHYKVLNYEVYQGMSTQQATQDATHKSTPIKEDKEIKEHIGADKSKPKSSKYDLFIADLKAKATTPSKITSTKQGRLLFKSVVDVESLMTAYLNHQLEKKEYAVRITAFMEDWIANINQPTNSNSGFQAQLPTGGFKDHMGRTISC